MTNIVEILVRDINMTAMTATMDTLMAQFRTIPVVEPTLRPLGSTNKGASASSNSGATIFANPQRGLAYNPIEFPPLPQLLNPEGMWAPLKGISRRVTALPYSFLYILQEIWIQ